MECDTPGLSPNELIRMRLFAMGLRWKAHMAIDCMEDIQLFLTMERHAVFPVHSL